MNTLVATDLDRTLIYSRAALDLGAAEQTELVCVEVFDGAPASFITASAAQTTVRLAEVATLMPVTTRIPAQLARVKLPGPPAPFAVAGNGGVLLIEGRRDRAWDTTVNRRLGQVTSLAEVWEHAAHACRPEWTKKLRNADGLFCYAVVDRAALPEGFLAEEQEWARAHGWSMSLQGRKLYWMPDTLTKSAAVREVAERVGAGLVLAAGDSLLDRDLLLDADRGVRPRHGELFESGWDHPSVRLTGHTGVRAGQEILEWFLAEARP